MSARVARRAVRGFGPQLLSELQCEVCLFYLTAAEGHAELVRLDKKSPLSEEGERGDPRPANSTAAAHPGYQGGHSAWDDVPSIQLMAFAKLFIYVYASSMACPCRSYCCFRCWCGKVSVAAVW